MINKHLRILFVEPFLGGSHQAFVEQWSRHSRHQFQIVGLPAYKWKWRMRHAPLTLAKQVNELFDAERPWHALVCSDMLSLAEFKGMLRPEIAALPTICYFHENQLTYPTAKPAELRDFHFAFTNFVTAVTANENWFNSQFHLDSFFDAMKVRLNRMPDNQLLDELDDAKKKSRVEYPGILPSDKTRRVSVSGPLKILWPHRWEFDKNPDEFFAALSILKTKLDFRLIVLGESFRDQPTVFAKAKKEFAAQIEHWGFVESREEYQRLVASADVAVSTATHEFFGMAMVEAAASGVVPILPNRLAYPEVFGGTELSGHSLFYDGSINGLVTAILRCESELKDSHDGHRIRTAFEKSMSRFHWAARATKMDDRIEAIFDRQ